MVDKTTIQFEIDAKKAGSGAKDIDSAVKKIAASLTTLQSKVDQTRKALSGNVDVSGFTRAATELAKINNIRIDTGLIKNLNALSSIKGPDAASIQRFNDLVTAVNRINNSMVTKVTSLTQAFSNFKGPPPSAAQRITNLITALANLKVPPQTAQIVAALNAIGNAANNASAGLSSLSRTRLNLGGINSQVNGARSSLGGLTDQFGLVGTAAAAAQAAVASFILKDLVVNSYQAATAVNQLKNAFTALYGEAGATSQMKFAAQVAQEFGLDLAETNKTFLQYSSAAKAANIETAKTNNLFRQLSGTAAVLGLSQERTNFAFLAVTQMMSKGMVNMEDLRQQLGEHLPGAIGIFADALGKTPGQFQKMVEAGQVGADMLILFGDKLEETFGDGFKKASESTRAELGRLNTVATLAYQTIGQPIVDALGPILREWVAKFGEVKDGVLQLRPEIVATMTSIGQSIGSVMQSMSDFAMLAYDNWDKLKYPVYAFIALNVAGVVATIGVAMGAMLGNVVAVVGAFSSLATGVVSVVSGAIALAPAFATFIAAAAPVAAVGVAIGAVVYALYKLHTAIQDAGGYLAVLNSAWETMKGVATSVIDWIADKFNALTKLVAGFGDVLAGVFTLDVSKVVEGFNEIESVIGKTTDIIVKDTKTAADAIVRSHKDAADNVGSAYASASDSVKDENAEIVDSAKGTATEVGKAMDSMADSNKENVKNATDSVKGMFDDTVKAAKSAAAAVDSAMSSAGRSATPQTTDWAKVNKDRQDEWAKRNPEEAKQLRDGIPSKTTKNGGSGLEDSPFTTVTKNQQKAQETYIPANTLSNQRNALGNANPLALIKESTPGSGSFGNPQNALLMAQRTQNREANNAEIAAYNDAREAEVAQKREERRSQTTSSTVGGAREKGGPVQKGYSYLTGEKGVELYTSNNGKYSQLLGVDGPQMFTPSANGMVHNAADTKAMMGDKLGGNDIVNAAKGRISGGVLADAATSVMGYDPSKEFAGEEYTQTTKSTRAVTNIKAGKGVDWGNDVSYSPDGKKIYGGGGSFVTVLDKETTDSRGNKTTSRENGLADVDAYLMAQGSKWYNQNYKGGFEFYGTENNDQARKDMEKSSKTKEFEQRFGGTGYTKEFQRETDKALHAMDYYKVTGGLTGLGSLETYGSFGPVPNGNRFANGGAFEVPANGSGDSTLAQLLLTGGERVEVTPKREVMGDRYNARDVGPEDGSARQVIINMEIKTPDPDAFRLSEKQIRTRVSRALENI